MRLVCIPTFTDRKTNQSFKKKGTEKEVPIPAGYSLREMETLYPLQSDGPMNVTVHVLLKHRRKGEQPLDLTFVFDASEHALTGTKTLLVR